MITAVDIPRHTGNDTPEPGELVDRVDIPGGDQLYLIRHGFEFEILSGEEQLMSSWNGASEQALATAVCERLSTPAPKLLIGGLGMGFTLRAALAGLPASASVVVAELVPGILAWANGPLAHLFGDALVDPRLAVELRDVHDVIEERPGEFDAILLDVDNGPDGLVTLANERLYSRWGLRAANAALKPGGMLAIWSADRDDAFLELIRRTGYSVEEIAVSTGDDEQCCPHYILLATSSR